LSINQTKMWAWGNPRFCHLTDYIQQRMESNICNLIMKFIKDFNFCPNTRAVMSWRYIEFWPGNSKNVISGHFWLHVNVINKHGCPHSRT
jgi:hypothetical protein